MSPQPTHIHHGDSSTRISLPPYFLCIGAQKAGTTWLSHNLSQHPEIWMPPIKELHHFDVQAQTPLILHLTRQTQSGIRAKKVLKVLLRAPLWGFRYLFQLRTPQTYRSLFQPSPGQICGEATPAYARQPESVIANIKSTLPNAKIIYLLRDPVERVWSQVRMASMKSVSTQESRGKKVYPSEQAMLDILEHKWGRMAAHSDYYGNLSRWQHHYPKKDIFVGYFDQLESDPKQFIQSILQFLNVRSDDAVLPTNVNVARNKQPAYTMPLATRRMVTERLFPQIESMHAYFDNQHTASWLQKAQATLREK